MTDDAPNSSDPQARRRRRRRRRGGAQGDAQRPERAGRGQDGQKRQADRRSDEGGRRRGGSGGGGEGRRTARGGEARAGEARAGEERPRRRKRRRRRGEERAAAAPGSDRPAGARAGGGPLGSEGWPQDEGADQGARGRSRGGKSRGRRRGARPTTEARAAAREKRPAGTGLPSDAPAKGSGTAAMLAGQGTAGIAPPLTGSEASDMGAGGDAAAPTWPDADNDVRPRAGTWGDADPAVPEAEETVPAVVELRPDLPAEPPADDPDPLSWPLVPHAPGAAGADQQEGSPAAPGGGHEHHHDGRTPLDRPVRNIIGVKFSSAGRIYLCDAGDRSYSRGEAVMVEGERGVRMGFVAVDAVRRPHSQQQIRQVLRRPNRTDARQAERNEERAREDLRMARDTARSMGIPVKIFRVEYSHSGKKALIYFTADDRVDFRDLVRELSHALKCRVEMRQTGVRDEAKMVGGIGSCGRELCCTTWLPEFVPVSIKMAKDQGLVLNPTKVSGQCGRLKCCLVYEQATYAALRKGLPKLGKRVVTEAGEGRVVEVDVLHQRVRVSLGPGEFQVFTADQVKPMFPSQQQNTGGGKQQ